MRKPGLKDPKAAMEQPGGRARDTTGWPGALLLGGVLVFVIFCGVVLERSFAVKALNAKGAQAFAAGDMPLAEEMFIRALLKDAGHIPAYINLGALYAKKENYARAMGAYEKVLALTRDTKFVLMAHNALALLYGNAAVPEAVKGADGSRKALAHLKVFEKTLQEIPGYQLRLGYAYFNAVDPGGGLQAFSRASSLAKGKDLIWVHEKLRDFYRQIRLHDKAETEQKLIDVEMRQ